MRLRSLPHMFMTMRNINTGADLPSTRNIQGEPYMVYSADVLRRLFWSEGRFPDEAHPEDCPMLTPLRDTDDWERRVRHEAELMGFHHFDLDQAPMYDIPPGRVPLTPTVAMLGFALAVQSLERWEKTWGDVSDLTKAAAPFLNQWPYGTVAERITAALTLGVEERKDHEYLVPTLREMSDVLRTLALDVQWLKERRLIGRLRRAWRRLGRWIKRVFSKHVEGGDDES